jgi:general secretion pathway protein C
MHPGRGIYPGFLGQFTMLKAFNSHHNGLIMASRFFAFIAWAAVAASIAYWGLRWLAPPTGVPASATSVKLGGALQGDFRRLFVANQPDNAAPTVDPGAASQLLSRVRILGAVAPLPGRTDGVALLSIDGKPPRAIRIGQVIDGEMVLLGLNQRQAEIGPAGGPAMASIELPRLPPPATGTLPPASGVTTSPSAGNAPGLAPGTPDNPGSNLSGEADPNA